MATSSTGQRRLLPAWLADYRRSWLVPDLVAGLLVWGVVTPQAVAYAQIAGLPPSAGLVAAPGALVAYALLGTSRTLVVSATTATSALSAAAVGPLADGDLGRFAALSAGLAAVVGVVLVVAGLLRLGGVMDLVSKPVMTGFLFGLGLTVAIGQLPKVFGVPGTDGQFFDQLWGLLGNLDDTDAWTLATGAASIALLLVLRRFAPRVPGMLVVLVLSIVVSKLLNLADHGVAVVGELPSAYPDPEIPDVSWRDVADLIPAALGMLIVSAEAASVSREIARAQGYEVDTNRDLIALGASNGAAGLSSGFVQSGGASQTLAAEQAGGKTQLTSIVAAGAILLTGLFLTGLFRDLPEATLAAIVIVAISGFWRVDELVRLGRLRVTAAVFALVALVGVLVLGILPGLVVAALLSLVYLIQQLSRPALGALARDPATGHWGRADRHPEWDLPPGIVVARADGPLFYANAAVVETALLDLVRSTQPAPRALVLDLQANTELDVQAVDMLGELAARLEGDGIELRLTDVHEPALALLERAGLVQRVRIEQSIDAAVPSSADNTVPPA